jgi:hypothetical protein
MSRPDAFRITGRFSRNQNRFPRPPVKANGFPGSERLPSTSAPRSAAFASAPILREPATDLAALPPTIRLPTLLHPPECSRVGRLDPSPSPWTLRPRARWATRRLSTSAIDTIHEHNRESPELRRTSPAVARWRSHFHDVDLSVAILNCGWQRLLRDTASRGFTGQGPCRRQLPPTLGTSHRDRSRRELRPNPIDSDTSCRCSLHVEAGDATTADVPNGSARHELA